MDHTSEPERLASTELRPLLIDLLRSPPALAAVARRSYVHDNGFTKVVLHRRQADESALRLHVWPAGVGHEGNIHNHCWDFTSVVLAGQLEFEEFVIDRTGPVPATRYAYASSNNFAYELRPFGVCHLRSAGSGVRRKGETYDMWAETLHRTWGAAATTTITLLAQGVRRRAHADVYVTRTDGVPTAVENSPLAPSDLRDLLEKITSSLH